MHAVVPVVKSLYEPAPHATQAADVLAAGKVLYRPAAQPLQAAAPEEEAKEPAAQAVHALVPVARALYVPALHALHVADEIAAVALLYDPLAQAAQGIEEFRSQQ